MCSFESKYYFPFYSQLATYSLKSMYFLRLHEVTHSVSKQGQKAFLFHVNLMRIQSASLLIPFELWEVFLLKSENIHWWLTLKDFWGEDLVPSFRSHLDTSSRARWTDSATSVPCVYLILSSTNISSQSGYGILGITFEDFIICSYNCSGMLWIIITLQLIHRILECSYPTI